MDDPKPLVSGFSHVAIVCTDLDASREFYLGLLGLEELPRPDLGVAGMWLRLGDLQLHFIESDTMPVPGPGFPHFAVHVNADDWESTMEHLREANVPFLSAPSEHEDFGRRVRAAFVLDPSGNTVEFTDLGPLG